jgi:sulfate-transporting ATPase
VHTVLTFALIGCGIGAIYAIVAQGLVVLYKGSGILNFAQGAFVLVGGYAYYSLTVSAGMPYAVGFIGSALVTGLIGGGLYYGVFLRLRQKSDVANVIASVGVLLVIQAIALLTYGYGIRSAPSPFSIRSVRLLGVPVGVNQVTIFAIGLGLTICLWSVYRYTRFGRVTAAAAQDPFIASALGHGPQKIGTLNWILGSGLAGLAGALIVPITFLEPTTLPTDVLFPALAAALIGSFGSFPWAFGGAILLGISDSLLGRYVHVTGVAESAPLLVVIVILALRGSALPGRANVRQRLAVAGSGRIRPVPVAVATAAAIVVILFGLNARWTNAVTISLIMATIALSIVMITGYGGQVSLAQYALAGVGALASVRLVQYVPLVIAVIGGAGIAVCLGSVVAIVSLRTRGINLAVATIGLAIVVFDLVLNNPYFALPPGQGLSSGYPVRPPSLFGWTLDPLGHPKRYAIIVLLAFVGLAIVTLNVRRGSSGRRLLAMRANERAAAAIGVNVRASKFYAFAVGTAIASIGGSLFAFLLPSFAASTFDVVTSLGMVANTVVGGVGFVGGAAAGSVLAPGGVGSEPFRNIQSLGAWLPLIGGLTLLYVLIADPAGMFDMYRRPVTRLISRWSRPHGTDAETAGPAIDGTVKGGLIATQSTVERRTLRVTNLRTEFGGVVANRDVSLEVRPGEIHGLIGPNGAGKTTLIDAMTGFVKPCAGSVHLDDLHLDGWGPHRRLRAGLSRSFQSVELFGDLTVLDNLAVACDTGSASLWFKDLVRPAKPQLGGAALAAVEQFGLRPHLGRNPEELSFGQRRLLGIARAVASAPSVLLLDEPAAGVDDTEAAEIGELVRQLAYEWGIGILLVEHNIDMVLAISDRITVLAAGAVIFQGSPKDVRHDTGVMDSYLGRPLEVADNRR